MYKSQSQNSWQSAVLAPQSYTGSSTAFTIYSAKPKAGEELKTRLTFSLLHRTHLVLRYFKYGNWKAGEEPGGGKQTSIGPLQYLTEVCHNEFSLVYRFSRFSVHHLAAPVSRLTVCNRGLRYVCREQDKGILPPDIIRQPYSSKPLLLQWNLTNICCLVGS